jgi:hypothetical protein
MPLTQVPGSMINGAGFASLSGITFPATQVPSADANTLDDYEEGTWTPSLFYLSSGGSTGVTYTANRTGLYTKVGNAVIAQGIVELSNKGVGTGIAVILGLPFAAAPVTILSGGAVGYTANFTTVTPNTVYTDQNTTQVVLYNNGAASNFVTNANINNNSVVAFQITYRVA